MWNFMFQSHYLVPSIYASSTQANQINVIHIPWFLLLFLTNNIFICTPLKCSASLHCVGWTEKKSLKVILQYSYASEQIHKHTAKSKDYKIMHEDNYLFF